MSSSRDELISALVISLLLFTWIWGRMSSSRDELISALVISLLLFTWIWSRMSSSRDELISALVISLLLFTWIWSRMSSSRDDLIWVPSTGDKLTSRDGKFHVNSHHWDKTPRTEGVGGKNLVLACKPFVYSSQAQDELISILMQMALRAAAVY